MKISTRFSKGGRTLAAITTGLLLASATANASVIFQADFNGTNGGTGGPNDLVTLGGTGAIVADGVNVVAFVTNANPFAPGAGNYLETQKLTTSGGGEYSPVLFTFASNSNSWAAWQGDDILDSSANYDINLHGASDVFFRVVSNPDGSGTNDMFCIRTFDQFSWSDGGYGMQMVLNGEDSGNMTFQFANAGFNGTTAPAITNFNSSGGNISYSAAYDTILMQFFCDGNELTNGLVYHCAFSLDTDSNGLTTATVYLAQGTGALGPSDIQGWATFNILSSNLLNWSGVPTNQ